MLEQIILSTPDNLRARLENVFVIANQGLKQLEIPLIDPNRFRILSNRQYEKQISILAISDSHPDRIEEGEVDRHAFIRTAVCPQNSDFIFFCKEHLTRSLQFDSSGIMLAGTSAHEWTHRLSIDARKVYSDREVTIPLARLIGPKQADETLKEYRKKYHNLSFVVSGPAIEIRSDGKLLAYYNLLLAEFAANLPRFWITQKAQGTPYTLQKMINAIRVNSSLGFINDNNGLTSDQIQKILAVLLVEVLPIKSIQELVINSYVDPIKFLEANPEGLLRGKFASIIRYLRELDSHALFVSLDGIYESTTNLEIQRICELLIEDLFVLSREEIIKERNKK
jgi:hypothetical protein